MTRMGCWGRQPEDIAAQETREHLALILSHSRIGYRAGGQGKVRARGHRKGGGRLTGFQGARAGRTRAANCCNLLKVNAEHIMVIFGAQPTLHCRKKGLKGPGHPSFSKGRFVRAYGATT